MPSRKRSPHAASSGVRSVTTRSRIPARSFPPGFRCTSIFRSAMRDWSPDNPAWRSSSVGCRTRRRSPSRRPASAHSPRSHSGSLRYKRSTIFQIKLPGRKGAPSMSFDTRDVFHAGKISFSFPPRPRTRRATSRTSFVNEYSVLPRLEAWAARDCAVFDSTYTSCLVIRRCLRFALGLEIFSERILAPCKRSGSVRTRWWSVSTGRSTGRRPAAGDGRGLQDERDEVVCPVVPFYRELEGTHKGVAPQAHLSRLFRQEFVDVGGDALIPLRLPQDQDPSGRNPRCEGGILDGRLQGVQVLEGRRLLECFDEDGVAGGAEGDRPPQLGRRSAHVCVERICEAALPRQEGRDRDGAGDRHEAADIGTRGGEVGEDPLDGVLPFRHVHHRVCLTDALDHPVPQGEVVEERPQVPHQLEDDKPQDEQGDQDDSDEEEPADGNDLQVREDDDEDEEDQAGRRAGYPAHGEEERDDRDEQEERGAWVPTPDRGEDDDEEEVEEQPHGDEHADIAQHPPDLRRLAIDGLRQVEDRGHGILHGACVAGRLFAVHAERDAWGYLMGSGRTGTRPTVSRGMRESTNDRGPNHGLGREDAFQGLQPSRELRDPPGIAVHNEDLQTRLLVEVGVGRGADEPEELVLTVEEPMRDHPDLVPVYDRDRPDDVAPGRKTTPSEGLSNQITQGLRATAVSFLRHEPIEVRQERSLQGNPDALDRHVSPPAPHGDRPLRRNRLPVRRVAANH